MDKQRGNLENRNRPSKTLSQNMVFILYHNLKKSDEMTRKHKKETILRKKKVESTD